LANTPVNVVEVPAVIEAAPGVKLVITGAGTTVTVVCAVTDVPAEFVTVRVNVVVAANVPVLAAVPLVTAPTLLLTLPVPPVDTPRYVVEFPVVTVAAAGVKLVITGAATTVTVVWAVTDAPAVLLTVRV